MDQQKTIETLNTALRHHRAGELAQAEPLYRQVLAIDPNNADALHLLGVLARQCGRADAAVELIERAIVLFPNSAEYHVHLGEALADLRHIDRAIEQFEIAIRLRPEFAEAHRKLADVHHAQGRFEEAERGYRCALSLQPDDAESMNNLGNLLRKVNRLVEAEEMFRRVIQLRQDMPQPHNNLALVLREMGRLAEAEAECQVVIRMAPNHADIYNNLGNIYVDQRRNDEAEVAYRRAVELNPKSPYSHNNLGTALEHRGRLDDASVEYRRAIELAPQFAEAHSNLANVLRLQALHDDSIAEMRKAVELQPDNALLHSNLLYGLHFHPGIDPEVIRDQHKRWAERHADRLTASARPHENDRSVARRLRIGYVSPDFYEHAVGRLLLPLLEHRDREQFEVISYSGVPTPDRLTDRLRGLADEWHSTIGVSDDALAEMIRTHRIDILIDLTLHSADNRMLTFARKPAPVQVSYLGYPSTTGMTAMDWRLTDHHLDPPGNDALYVEPSLRLARTYWCYQPHADMPEVQPPAMRAGCVTFGCLNNFAKLNDRVLACWARILAAVQNSRLLLHAAEGSHRQRVQRFFESHKIAPDRIEFQGKAPYGEYFAAHHRIDVALDPFPYTGGTTTCDALWMGVPVITLAGRSAVQRGGVSLLASAGLGQWIAGSETDYVALATRAASDLSVLCDLRHTMRQRLTGSPLMQPEIFARDVEQAYRFAWRNWCAR